MKQTFRQRLVDAMRSKGLTQTELSVATGISKARINQYVNGVYEAKQDGVYLIAKALNVSEAWLMGFDVPRERTQTDEQTAQNVELDEHEYAVIQALRSQPEMREAVDRLLGIK